ncbi:unnamed protein product [Phytophthora lilii]|uniref:Unnamed protein product n=1 Tax=Phytophthora lilii TaxID=2077276 RepID=A0A9W6YFA7_9STRA|nr:unnamed protein product [Phytophthora lilii]
MRHLRSASAAAPNRAEQNSKYGTFKHSSSKQSSAEQSRTASTVEQRASRAVQKCLATMARIFIPTWNKTVYVFPNLEQMKSAVLFGFL